MKKRIDKIFQNIENRKKQYTWASLIYISLTGCFMFPIDMTRDFTFWWMMVIGYLYIGLIFTVLYLHKPVYVFFTTIGFIVIGLSLRMFLEWTRYGLIRYFTTTNVIVFLLFPSLFITITYMVIGMLRKTEQ